MRRYLKCVVVSVFTVLGSIGIVLAAPPRYRLSVVDGLVMPPFEIPPRNGLVGLNNAGAAVGARHSDQGANIAIVVQNGIITDLPSVPGYTHVQATGISGSGLIIGHASNIEYSLGEPVLWSGGSVQVLPSNPAWGTLIANDINDAGVIVGLSLLNSGLPVALKLENGVLTALPPPEGFDLPFGGISANALNAAGDVVGFVRCSHAQSWPVLWRDGEPELLPMPADAPRSAAVEINDAGLIVGTSWNMDSTEYRSFIWGPVDDGFMEIEPLPNVVPGIQATAINNSAQVVGQAGRPLENSAFLWQDGVTHDLMTLLANPEGVDLSYALDINDHGVVLAVGVVDGEPRSVLLTPVLCLADWNGDTEVTTADIAAFLEGWLASLSNGNLAADISRDGAVNSLDISAFITIWLGATGVGC